MRNTTLRGKEAELAAEIVAAAIGMAAVILLVVAVGIATSAMTAFLVWIAFALSGAQRRFFSMLARPLRRMAKSRDRSEQEDLGHARGSFRERRPAMPLVIEHDPDEFSRKRI